MQDRYLKAEIQRQGVVEPGKLEATGPEKRVVFWEGDMTRVRADAVVTWTDSNLLGADASVYFAAGLQLRLECDRLVKRQGYPEPVGCVKVTGGYNLPCKYVFHTVGPVVYTELQPPQERLLAACYLSCLEAAAHYGVRTLVFGGAADRRSHFPRRQAVEIGLRIVSSFVASHESLETVVFTADSRENLALYKELAYHRLNSDKMENI